MRRARFGLVRDGRDTLPASGIVAGAHILPDHSGDGQSISMMRVIIPLYFTMAIREIFLGALRGYGNARTPMLLSLAGMVGIRQIYLFIVMGMSYRIEYIFYCYPIAWGSTALLLVLYYFFTRKRYMVRIR